MAARIPIDWPAELQQAFACGESRAQVARRLGVTDKTVYRYEGTTGTVLADGRRRPREEPGNNARRVGDTLGALTILGIDGHDAKTNRPLYRVACTCGREDLVSGAQLSDRKPPIRTCTACRTPRCRVCGVQLEGPGGRRTCSRECRRALTAINRTKHAAKRYPERFKQLKADPDAWRAHLDRSNDYYQQKAKDPDFLEDRRKRSAHYRTRVEQDRMLADIAAVRSGLNDKP